MALKWEDLKIGDTSSLTRVATSKIILAYANISEDFNPIHLDEGYSKKTAFGGCIAHALFCLGMISKIIGMDMPGEGAAFLNERVSYKAPVYVDDIITATVEIYGINIEKRLIDLRFFCTNDKGKLILEGNTTVKMMEKEKKSDIK